MSNDVRNYVITDHSLREVKFASFELAMMSAIELTSQNNMTTITMPDGRRYTLLETARSKQRLLNDA